MKKKTLLTICALVLVVALSVAGTVAWLTDDATVTNTFSVGNVTISMDEAPVDAGGQATAGDRVTANSYKLIPGKAYDKDPIVYVGDNSEDCYVFIHVTNDIAAIESDATGYKTIAAQIADNGWTAVAGHAGYYYQSATAGDDLAVFDGFTVDGDVTGATLADYAGKTVVVNAFAIQSEGLTLEQAVAQFPGTF